MSILATATKHMIAMGVANDTLVDAIAQMEANSGTDALVPFIKALQTTTAVPEPIGKAIYEVACLLTEAERPKRDSKAGPLERWGYDGPVTPRLAERDWLPLRASVLRAAGNTCHYCGDKDAWMCVDHVLPLSRGGTNDTDNLVACCMPCNSSKGDMLLAEWKGRGR